MDSVFTFYTTYLAAAYNCDAYGAGNYNEGGQCTTTNPGTGTGTNTGTTTGTNSGSLVDTGSPVFYTLAAGVLLVAVALAIVVYKIVRRKQLAK